MTTYKELFGKPVKHLSTDPTDAEAAGQVWYNTTSGTFKSVVASGAWSSGTNMPEANYGAGGAGSQTAFLYFGGAPYPSKTNATREYNGSGWTTGGNYIGSYSYLAGCGTQTAGLGAGGQSPTQTSSAEYDGSTWTAGNSMSQQRQNTGSTMCGTQPAALIVGGDQYPSTPRSVSACEEYGGTSWTAGGAYPVVIQNIANAGTQTAGWAAGGMSDANPGTANTVRTATNHYNGTSWTAGGEIPTATIRAGAAGTQTAGLFFSGLTTANVATTFGYDGSSWTAGGSMATARQSVAAGGVSSTSTAAIGAGGYVTPGVTASTEEYNFTINTVTAAAFSAGGNLPAVIAANQGGGTQTAGISISGQITGPGSASTTATNEYNGSAWTAGGAVASGASSYSGYSSQKGTQTSMLFWGGYGNPGGARSTVSSYDGSSWTAQPAFPATIIYGGGAGTQTAAFAIGQYGGSGTTKTFEGDGSYNWTAGGDLSTGRYANATCGPQTAAITAGGVGPTAATEVYNGTSWTAGGNLVTAAQNKAQCFGADSSDMVIATKRSSSPEGYDGTAWSTRPSMGTPRDDGGGSGSVGSAGSINGGNVPGFTAATEEFTGDTTALNVKTITTS